MLAQVRPTLRRTAQTGVTPRSPLLTKDMAIDFSARWVTCRSRVVRLPATEHNLMAHLAISAGQVLTHGVLLQAVWGPETGDETHTRGPTSGGFGARSSQIPATPATS